MTAYTDHLRDWTEQTIERLTPTPEELAEQAARAQANRLAAIMAPAPVTRTSEAASAIAPAVVSSQAPVRRDGKAGMATSKAVDIRADPRGWWAAWLTETARMGFTQKAFDRLMAEFAGVSLAHRKTFANLHRDLDDVKRQNAAMAARMESLCQDVNALKREAELAKRLAEQNLKRKVDLLELENRLLRAGRTPAEPRDEAESELPQFLGNGHAQ